MSSTDLSGRFTSPRVKWTDDELRIVLGYYFFIYENNTREQDYESFSDDLRKMTGNSRSNGSVGVRFGNFISVDPSKTSTGFPGGNKKCLPIWNECINPDRTPKESFIRLFMDFVEKYGNHKKIYLDFISKYSDFKTIREIDLDDDNLVTSEDICDEDTLLINKELLFKKEGKIFRYNRDISKAKKVIIDANYKCTLNPNHESFITKNDKIYMEAHHLIPICMQELYDVNIDVEANILCLCSCCHRKLHFGKNIEDDLKILYNMRIKELQQNEIDISFEDLLKYYK